MKKIGLILIFVLTLVFAGQAQAQNQLYRNGWNLTFGLEYPRFAHHSLLYGSSFNWGIYGGIQRNLTESMSLRAQLKFEQLQGFWGYGQGYGQVGTGTEQTSNTYNVAIGLDFLYHIAPGENFSPYIGAGLGPNLYFLNNSAQIFTAYTFLTYHFNTVLGFEYALSNDWKLKSEFQYVVVADGKFDGNDKVADAGIFGAYPSYFTIDIGLNYYFDKGEAVSPMSKIYTGLQQSLEKTPVDRLNAADKGEKVVVINEKGEIKAVEPVDYSKIENIVKNNIPKTVVKEVVVEKLVEKKNNWVLIGVNFENNSAKFTAESFPILYGAAQTLLLNPEVKVEIQGYTDSNNSEEYNKKLSQKRAEAVKDYLVARGVAADRLTAVGYGESNPIGDNKTAEGRAMNRRIVFKVK